MLELFSIKCPWQASHKHPTVPANVAFLLSYWQHDFQSCYFFCYRTCAWNIFFWNPLCFSWALIPSSARAPVNSQKPQWQELLMLELDAWCFSDFVTVPHKQLWCGLASSLLSQIVIFFLKVSASLPCFTLLCSAMKLDGASQHQQSPSSHSCKEGCSVLASEAGRVYSHSSVCKHLE